MKDKQLRKALDEADIFHMTTEWMGVQMGWRRGDIPSWTQVNRITERLDALLDYLGLEAVLQDEQPDVVVHKKKQAE